MVVIRYGLVLLCTSAALGCQGFVEPEPGSISLSITPTSAGVVQGGGQSVTATLTRTGSLSGTVDLFVTGQPAGVTTTVSDKLTSGAVTTATVTFAVSDAVEPAVYPLVVHGTRSGADEVTQAFTLTITPGLGFSISLSETTLSVMQGFSTATTMVSITRGSHHGAVDLEVTGLPSGVAASFIPPAGLTGNSAVLTLTVSDSTLAGAYSLRVNASNPEQAGDVSTPLRLTITPAPGYTMTLTAQEVSLEQGTYSQDMVVSLYRSSFTGAVTLSGENLPAGVSAYFYPSDGTTGSSALLTVFVAGSVLPGTYTGLLVRGVAAGLADRTAPLTLTVRAAPFVLALSSPTISIAQGAATPTMTVNILRNSFTGPVTLYIDVDWHGTMPAGVKAAFAPNGTTGNSSVLTFTVSAAAVPGVYYLSLYGEGSNRWYDGGYLTLTVTAPTGSSPR